MENSVAFVSFLTPKPTPKSDPYLVTSGLNLTVHTVTDDVEDPVSALRTLAVQWVHDEVGKNNYVDTLDSEKLLTDEAVNTYTLRYAKDDKKCIHVYWIFELAASWWGTVPKVPVHLGSFKVVPVLSLKTKYQDKYEVACETIIALEERIGDLADEKIQQASIIAELQEDLPVKLTAQQTEALTKIRNQLEQVGRDADAEIARLKSENEKLALLNFEQQVHIVDLESRLRSIDGAIDLLRDSITEMDVVNDVPAPAPSPVRKPTPPKPLIMEKTGGYDGVISELKKFNFASLKKVSRDELDSGELWARALKGRRCIISSDDDADDEMYTRPPLWLTLRGADKTKND